LERLQAAAARVIAEVTGAEAGLVTSTMAATAAATTNSEPVSASSSCWLLGRRLRAWARCGVDVHVAVSMWV
jgi:hypothetical protein